MHISVAGIGANWHAAAVFAVSIAALAALGTRPPRFPAGDALLVGIAVSLLVNDSPVDVASAGSALVCGALGTRARSTTDAGRCPRR